MSQHVLSDPAHRGRRTPAPRTAAPRTALALAAAALLAGLAACAPASAGTTTDESGATVLRYQGSVGQVGYPELAEDLGYFEDVTLEWIGDVTGGPASIQATATGETDFGGAFNGAIVKLRSSGARITSVIGYYGSDDKTYGGYYVPEDSPIQGAHDLLGKKIGINTLGAQSEFVIREWLTREGLTKDEIAQVELTVVPPINAEQVLREGQVDVSALSFVQKDVAEARGGLRSLFSEKDLFGEFTYGSLVFRDEFVEENPEAVADFVQGVARAIRWAQVSPVEEVRERYTRIITERGRDETTDLIPVWKSTGIAGPGGVIAEEEISTWVDWLVREGELEEGQVALDDLYTNEFNPYDNGTYEPGSGPDGESLS
ncbi:ABC transporter substrate-binding protein [Cellulomonas biazotea]|uniref:ABC transporter substrate-binding protein n=1 Tax=Cellulomonas biazotea TaxID=1709 RepID=A0A402DMP5_9CELL|nr:ABC transporter substrate-binding protein [Cellulomonas biazotea]GCE75397.1 ABC transporter substrate-binding protein [Cellulomonas biazotea]